MDHGKEKTPGRLMLLLVARASKIYSDKKVRFAAVLKSLTSTPGASISAGPCRHVTLGFVQNELMTSGSSKCRLTPEKVRNLLATQTELDRACCLLWNTVWKFLFDKAALSWTH